MYPVSDAFKTAVEQNSRKYYWTGTITDKNGKVYEFGNEDIVKGSGYITRQCCGSSEIELGTVYAGELGISLFLDFDRYTLDDAEIRLWFHLVLDDGTVESVPMGVFFIAEANRGIKTIELKAYDAMLNLEKSFNKGLSSAYPYDFLSLLAKNCKVELAQSKEEIESLPNGTELFGIYQDNDIETWRDFLYYLAQALGCFTTIDREGKLLLTSYGNTEVKRINNTHRFSSTFSDFVTRYTAVNSTNKRTETAEYYSIEPDDGLTMNLGVNPLLQFGLDETRKRIITNILNTITIIQYVPFDSETIGDPSLDLGDVLKFTGGHADESSLSAITSITTKVNGKQTVKCVGKNPKLSEAKSKSDKNISGLINSITETKLSVYSFTNALALNVGEDRVSIINMEFASGEETNAEFHAEAILDVSTEAITRSITAEASVTIDSEEKIISFPVTWSENGTAELTVYYVLDGHEVEAFHPKDTCINGEHLLNLYYPMIELSENQLHTFEVLLSVSSGSVKIDAQNIMATISGQGLGVQERWDGNITAEESMKKIVLSAGMMPTHTLKESTALGLITPIPTGLSDQLASIPLTGMPMHTLKDIVQIWPVITTDVVETADKAKMRYAREYVLDADTFKLRLDYEAATHDSVRLDRGRMLKLVIPTAAFDHLTSLTIQPFETESFMNALALYAEQFVLTKYTKVEDSKMVLIDAYDGKVDGEDISIDRGRLATFRLGLGEMETAEGLEVSIG